MKDEQEEKPFRPVLLAVAVAMLLVPATSAPAQVSVELGFPGVHIGIDVPSYPHLVRVPGYPVYYDSRASSNYFFYDGLYWVYWEDGWYSSPWYNGPWEMVGPEYVPLYMLRVPVRYYRQPPTYFHGWRANAPPRWGDHWGQSWESRRSGWDRWNRRSVPAPAPLPTYQRRYTGDRYPRTLEQERSIRTQNYRYRPREAVSQQRLAPAPAPAPAPMTREARPAPRIRESHPAPQVRESRPAPQARESRPAPQVRESHPAPQVRESRPAPQAREKKAAPQNSGHEKKDKGHGQERGER